MEENKTEIKPLDQTFQSIYNQAVEHCVSIVNGYVDGDNPSFDTQLSFIINDLEKLKK